MRATLTSAAFLLLAIQPAEAQEIQSPWVIRGGVYAGDTVAIDPARAARKGSRFWRMSSHRGDARVIAWNPSRLPVAVAFRDGARVGEADSAAFWEILRKVEADMGMQLFVPVSLERGSDPDDVIVIDVKPMISGAGLTLVTWSTHGSVYDARVFLSSRSSLHDARVVTHEMMHALGFGHTTAWKSVMNPAVLSASRLTREDVAYVQAALAARAATERYDMWSRLALAVSREPAPPAAGGYCDELFRAPVRFPAGCTSYPCSESSASCAAARNTGPSPER